MLRWPASSPQLPPFVAAGPAAERIAGSARCVRAGGSPSAVQVAAPPPAEALWPELPLQKYQALDLRAVRANVGFDVGGQLADGGQVDAE